MNSTNKNIPSYKANSRGNKRGGRGGYNGSNYNSETKVETINTPNKPNFPPHPENKDSESNLKIGNSSTKNSTSNTNPASIHTQIVESTPIKKVSKSKKANIDFNNLPDINFSSQKNLDVSVNESKGEFNPDTSLISEDNRANNNENDKSLLSVENFEVTNKTGAAGNSRKQSGNFDMNVLINNANPINNTETIIDDVSINDEINLNSTNNEEGKENDVVSAEGKDGYDSNNNDNEKENLDDKINEVKIEVKVSVENVKENIENKGTNKFKK